MIKKYKVNIRHIDGVEIRPEAMPIDGQVFSFNEGWVIEEEDSPLYVGETAMIPIDPSYPDEAPTWIASGDLTCQ